MHQIRSGIAFVTITGLAELDAEVLFIPLWALAHGKLVTLVETGSGVRSHAGNWRRRRRHWSLVVTVEFTARGSGDDCKQRLLTFSDQLLAHRAGSDVELADVQWGNKAVLQEVVTLHIGQLGGIEVLSAGSTLEGVAGPALQSDACVLCGRGKYSVYWNTNSIITV